MVLFYYVIGIDCEQTSTWYLPARRLGRSSPECTAICKCYTYQLRVSTSIHIISSTQSVIKLKPLRLYLHALSMIHRQFNRYISIKTTYKYSLTRCHLM